MGKSPKKKTEDGETTTEANADVATDAAEAEETGNPPTTTRNELNSRPWDEGIEAWADTWSDVIDEWRESFRELTISSSEGSIVTLDDDDFENYVEWVQPWIHGPFDLVSCHLRNSILMHLFSRRSHYGSSRKIHCAPSKFSTDC